MNPAEKLIESNCFPSHYTVESRIVTLIRKLGFLEFNKYLKDHGIINRYKRNFKLEELHLSNYLKLTSLMVRELIEFTLKNSGVDCSQIYLEKKRNYNSFVFTIRLPSQDQIVEFLAVMREFRDAGYLSWRGWRHVANTTSEFAIEFSALPMVLRHTTATPVTLQNFVLFLESLGRHLAPLHPLPVEIATAEENEPVAELAPEVGEDPTPGQPIEADALDQFVQLHETTDTRPPDPLPENQHTPAAQQPVNAQANEPRRTPIVLRRID
jgi:hypothetical protein